ncbi:MAG: sensor histidine kinase [Rariglobus sp.]|nr:HAMP domain-containing sensor histidine kinase [Rariglobus sp.]
MRYPLALKVSGWLLLNLVLLTALAAGLLVVQGGFNWNALVEGPPGRRVQDLAEATLSTLRSVPRERRDEVIADFSKTHGISAAVIGASGQHLTGETLELPPAIAEMVRPPGPPPDRFQPGEPEDQAPPPPPAKRRPRLLIRDGDPAVFWLAVRINTPERPPSVIVMRIPTFGVLLKLLDLAPWLWAAAAAIGVSLLFWLPFVRSLTRDLGRLNRATEAIADGRFDARVPEDRRDELGELGGSVNRMAGRLDRLVAGQKRFLGDIAHELGSPIGRMQVSVEILEQRADPSLHNAINDVREEIDHMSALVGELLAFTKAGLKARDAILVPVALTQLADRALAREAADDAVTVNLPPSLHVRADADLLARAVGNLVRNALRHAGRTSHIALRAETDGDFVLIIVEDEGPGVPPDALARLGEPLFRPEAARTRETGGAGLGLAIVKSCVEACGGTVRFDNRSPRGFRATLRLPAA